jgi:hypothetical protein|tara:strand:- start:2479 stop:2973 length:495 start_codon:yes stop_codon:yes gene_type:complete
MVNSITINYEFISQVEQLRGKDLKLEHILILSIVNSFNRQGKNCSVSRSTFSKLCRCDTKTIQRRIKDLVKWNMITLHVPKNQSKTHQTCITHIHKDLKQILVNLAVPLESTGLCTESPQAGVRLSTNNKIMDKSVSSLGEDPSSSDKEDIEAALYKLFGKSSI